MKIPPRSKLRKRLQQHAQELRESAIEPLPPPSPMPAALRRLDWYGDEERTEPEPADVVRRLSGKTRARYEPEELEASQQNELGCAYAVLAWAESSDEYWLCAIEAFRAAKDCPGAGKDVKERAKANLDAVEEESGFPIDGPDG